MWPIVKLLRCHPLALLLLVPHLGGCTSWQPATVSPRQAIEGERPSSIQVTNTDGTQMVLSYPTVENDSIVGRAQCPAPSAMARAGGEQTRCAPTGSTVRVPLNQVRSVQLRRVSILRTVGGILIPIIPLTVLIVVLGGGAVPY